MARVSNICMGLALLLWNGCRINDSDPSREESGIIQGRIEDENASGSGLVFMQTDSTYRLRGLLGAPEDHISIDIDLENLEPGAIELNPDSNGISVVRIIGRDAVGAVYGLDPSRQNTLVLEKEAEGGRISGTLTLNLFNAAEEKDRLKAALSFAVPVSPGLENAWDCDFSGENVKGCHFIE